MRFFMRYFILLWSLLGGAQLSAAAGLTLDEALGQATPPAHGVALSVDAARVALPAGAILPGTKLTVSDAASLYNRASQSFGTVTALAPPTMTVLNTAPGEPNIYAGMPPLDAFTLLLASLSDPQWTALTSAAGLGVSDLTPAQQSLFASLLSHDGKLLVRPQYAEGETGDDHDQRDLTDALPQVHLRLGQTATLSLQPKEDPNSSYGPAPVPPPAGAPRRYEVAEREDYGGSAAKDYGADVRADVPNVPKRGQLDFSMPSLKMLVPLNGVKTVGDLIYRIGGMTHVEVYADPRLEKQLLTHLGGPSAPAADLLRALAFCLCGTFRQVGPAYVLTDDIVGIGTRRQIWAEFEEDASSLRRGPVSAAANALYQRHSPHELSWFDDPGAYSPEEIKSPGVSSLNIEDEFLPELKLPFAKLTSAQQDMAERGADKWNREYKMQPVTTDGLITVRPGLSTQLLVPGIATPIDLNLNHGGTDQSFVFKMSPEEFQEKLKAHEDEEQKKYLAAHPELAAEMAGSPAKGPVSAVFALLKPTLRRGAIIHPCTSKDVDADVAAAKMLGLNALWLDVFSDGTARLPGSALSDSIAAKTSENDILAEAMARTKGTGIRIFPLFDLLFWGQSPPAQDADLNILGETSAQAAARWQQRKALLPQGELMSDEVMGNPVIPDWPGVAVSPLAPDVQKELVSFMKTVAARPGIAGIVWRDTDTPGYDLLPGGSDTSSLLLGYGQEMRLSFLRRFHADPVDIYDVGHSGTLANTDLPYFSDQGSGNLMYALHDDWVKFRQDMGLAFLESLYAAVDPPNGLAARRVRILVKQRRRGQGGNDRFGHHIYPPGWYGSWDNPRLPPPTLHTMGEDDKPGQPMQPVPDETIQAKSQSEIVMTPITSDALDQMRQVLVMMPPANAKRPARSLPLTGYFRMPGFVLDLDKAPSGEDPLPVLAAEVTAETKPPAVSGVK
jgi:hypothetical protein